MLKYNKIIYCLLWQKQISVEKRYAGASEGINIMVYDSLMMYTIAHISLFKYYKDMSSTQIYIYNDKWHNRFRYLGYV